VVSSFSGELRAAVFEPVVRAAVELHQFTEARGTQAALARRALAVVARQTAEGFTTEGKSPRAGRAFHRDGGR